MKRSSFLRASGFGRGVRLFEPSMLLRGGVTLGIVLLIVIARFAFPDVFSYILSPVWKAGSALSASVGAGSEVFTTGAQKRADVARLIAEHEQLTAQNAVLTARVHDLTRLLGTRTEATSGIVAGVMARPPVSPYDVLVVDRGTEEGVAVGARVEGAGGIPVGVVAATSKHSARVLLYSAPGNVTSAWIGEGRVAVQVTGEGSGAFRAEVAREVEIHEGDFVYFMGPGAIPTGTVAKVSTNPSDTKSHVQIKPLVSPFSITWVTIVSLPGV